MRKPLGWILSIVVPLSACGGSGGGGNAPTPAPTPPSTTPSALRPSLSIRLSGGAASGLAAAGGWLWVTHFEGDVLSQVDPRAGREIGVVEVGPHGASATAIGAELWLAQYTNRPEDARLTWVEPLAAQVIGRAQPSNLCCELAGALGHVWAVDPRGALLEIDPANGREVARTPVSVDSAVHIGLMGDDRGLWLSSDTTPLLRVDPASGRVITTLDVGGGIPMALAQGLVWGASPRHVWAVDPGSNEVRLRLPVENTIEILSLAVSQNVLWLGARRPGAIGVVLRIDLASQRLTGEAAVGLPAKVLESEGRIWVVDWDANALLRFD